MRLISRNGEVAEQVQHLHPAYFAMVMSTGAVGIAAELLGMSLLATGLTWLNLIAFIILSAMTIARAGLYPHLLLLSPFRPAGESHVGDSGETMR